MFLDDIGYVQHDRDEMEVLFTLLAPSYPYCVVPFSSPRIDPEVARAGGWGAQRGRAWRAGRRTMPVDQPAEPQAQVAAPELGGDALTQRQHGGRHGRDAVFFHFARQGGGNRQSVEA